MERAALARCTGRLRSTQDDLQKFARWNRLELFKNIFAELARKGGCVPALRIDAIPTYQAHERSARTVWDAVIAHSTASGTGSRTYRGLKD